MGLIIPRLPPLQSQPLATPIPINHTILILPIVPSTSTPLPAAINKTAADLPMFISTILRPLPEEQHHSPRFLMDTEDDNTVATLATGS